MKSTGLPTIALLSALVLSPMAQARPIGRRGPERERGQLAVLRAFEPVVATARHSVVCIRVKGQVRIRATLIDDAGDLVTKASELPPTISTPSTRPKKQGDAVTIKGVLANDQAVDVTFLAKDHASDLALLRLNAEPDDLGLKPIEWVQPGHLGPALSLGTWVASVGQGRQPLGAGIISAPARTIDPRRVLLGIQIAPGKPGPKVVKTLEGMGAAKAGIEAGDQITHVGGDRTRTRQAVVKHLSGRLAGETVSLKVRRGDQTLGFKVDLKPLPESLAGRSAHLDRMGGKVSRRSRGFARVLQHDTVLSPRQIGSPLVNLKGKALGLNIARANRTATFALPAPLVRAVVKKLKAQ